MIVGFTGGRDLADYGIVVEAVHLSRFAIAEVVSGACGIDKDDPEREDLEAKGADGLAEQWAKAHGIPVRRFYAAWKRLGLKAGPIRNSEMAQVIDALVSLPGNRGTADMTKKAKARGIPVFVLQNPKGLKSVIPQEMYRSERFFSAMEKIGGPKYTVSDTGFPRRERDDEGNVLFPFLSLAEAQRLQYGLADRGYDTRIDRETKNVVATKKGLENDRI